jgi:hypothetical protein
MHYIEAPVISICLIVLVGIPLVAASCIRGVSRSTLASAVTGQVLIFLLLAALGHPLQSATRGTIHGAALVWFCVMPALCKKLFRIPP